MTEQVTNIEIVGEPTMNPAVCRFNVNRTLHENGSIHCTSVEQAAGSPLLERLFAIAGVGEVLVFGRSVTVAKRNDEDWREFGKAIGAAIRSAIAEGDPLISPEWNRRSPSEEAIRERVQRVFDEEINPSLSSHGGHVAIADVKGTSVYLIMQGGCQGCASADITLKGGIERAIRRNVPEVTDIFDVTDHAAGLDPYYK